MANDAVQLVASLGGELVTYSPHGGTAKTFKAYIEREQPPEQVASTAAGSYAVNMLEITFPMDATDGVLKVQARKDRVRFKKNVWDSEDTEFVVNKIIKADIGIAGSGGMFTVQVQA